MLSKSCNELCHAGKGDYEFPLKKSNSIGVIIVSKAIITIIIIFIISHCLVHGCLMTDSGLDIHFIATK